MASQKYKATYTNATTHQCAEVELSLAHAHILWKINESNTLEQLPLVQIQSIHRYQEHNVVINFGDYPYSTILCREPGFFDALKEQYRNNQHLSNYFKKESNALLKFLLIVAAFAILCLALIYIFVFPWIVNKAASKMPIEYEKKIGEQLFKQVELSEKINTDKSALLTQFFDSLHPNDPYQTKVYFVEKNEVNAFAMPGGYIVIYSGIINNMQSANELVGLLAHEYAHIALKHTIRHVINKVGFYAVLQVFLGHFDSALPLLFGQQVEQLRDLSYSRTLETEADKYGFEILKKQRINAVGMIDLFARLNLEAGAQVPALLSTHPLPESRIMEIKNLLQQQPYTFSNHIWMTTFFEEIKE